MTDLSLAQDPSFAPAAVHPSSIVAEIVVGRQRVTGELRWGGGHRRLVDVVNAIDGSFASIHNAELDDPFGEGGGPRRLDVLQVQKDSILFCIPRGTESQPANRFESVVKVPTPAVIVLPGFEITGNVHQVPGADPTRVPQVGSRQFIPMTEAVIVCSYGSAVVWREPLIAVNMFKAFIYAPAGQQALGATGQ